MLKRKLAIVEVLNDELQHTLSSRDNAISVSLEDLTNKSEAIESICEIEDLIHDLNVRMSESMERTGSVPSDSVVPGCGSAGSMDKNSGSPLFRNRLTIARTGHNDIQLKAAFIIRRHTVNVFANNGTRIVDRGSKNSVFVKTYRIKEQILRISDIITIGKADFKLEEWRKR